MHRGQTKFAGFAIGLGILLLGVTSMASEYPTKPITLINIYTAGGSTDVIA